MVRKHKFPWQEAMEHEDRHDKKRQEEQKHKPTEMRGDVEPKVKK